MKLIEAKNPSKAWLKVIRYIMNSEGKDISSDLAKENLYLIARIKNPLKIDERVDKVFREIVGDKWIDEVSKDFFPDKIDLEGFPTREKKGHYSYWNRLTRFKGINQLEFVIDRLKKYPRSKQVFATPFNPSKDIKPLLDNPERPFLLMPCLTALDFKCRNGKLNLLAMFRSHDFGRKAYGNYVGLGKLLNFVSKRSGHSAGSVICISCSAHIRKKEYDKVKRVLEILENGERE